MFTTTNVAAAAASAGGPVATVVSPTFQIISTPVTGPSSSSTTSSTWRLTPTSSSGLIKQPSVVSIINRNMNVTSSTSLPINSTGVTMPTNGTVYYITTTNSQQHNPITIGNLSVQSPQTVRLVSTPIQSSSSTPTLTRLNNSNTNVRQILTPSSNKISILFSK
jgi:hypothetical protein